MAISKKKTLTLALSSLFMVSTLGVSLLLSNRNTNDVAEGTPYSITINDGVSVESDYGVIASTSGAEFGFKFSYYTPGSGNVGTFTSEGELLNWDAFHSLQSISINIASGSYDLYTGWKQYESSDIEYSSNPFASVSSTGKRDHDLSAISPSYFKIDMTSDTVISSITLTYTCTSSTVVPSVRVRVAAPTVGGSGSILDTNYVWICTNIEDSTAGSWPSYVMNKDSSDDSWYYDFTNIDVASSGYGYTLVVCDSDTVIDWTYQADETGVGFGIGEGQSEFNITGVNFAGQPTPIASSYKLNLTINTSGSPSSFGNIQFVYNYTNSTSSYTWGNYIGYSWQSSYSYSIDDLDTSKTLYFRIYMWSEDSSLYVGNGSANFVINPTGSDINATVTFTYSTSSPITGTCVVDSGGGGEMSHPDVNTSVYGTSTISPTFSGATETFTAEYSGDNIRIDDNKTIVGLKAGTTTSVKLTSYSGLTCTFKVTIPSSTYSASKDTNWCKKGKPICEYEGWFTSTDVSEISDMGKDFYNGIDISSFKALVDKGTKFYNSDGVEQHLIYILKDAGVNWIRAKLWVDPVSTNGISYGGGDNSLNTTLWIAKEAKAAGMKFLLDFHYSDYWTDPTNQILPKSWNDCTSVNALCARIKSYTTTALQSFQNEGCLPDMVQLGNEISSGIYKQQYTGGDESLNSYGEPSYLTNKTSYSYGTTDWSKYTNYIKAASEGVDAVDNSIKKVLHWAQGGTKLVDYGASPINNFFNAMPSAYYDYAAISYYPFYCFNTMSQAQSILNGISISKPWFVAEVSYPFSGYGYTDEGSTNFTISYLGKTGDTSIYTSYEFNGEGQANMIHDLTAAVVNAGGLGMFYWEGAWVPNLNVGWAGSGSTNSWGNQGFFSFDGKAIANLDLFAQMSKYI